MIPRGKYLGKRVGDPPKDEAEHFIRCPACVRARGAFATPVAGSTSMTGAQFEIDQKDLALLAAQILKSRNPNSVVKVKDLKTGEEIVIVLTMRRVRDHFV